MLQFLPRLALCGALLLHAVTSLAGAPCRPFAFYQNLNVPEPTPLRAEQPEEGAVRQDDGAGLLATISVKHGSLFLPLYQAWQAPPGDKERWLACVHPYLVRDSDGDGLADWTAVIDERPSRLLVPLDPDIDNDGLVNILDPALFQPGDQPRSDLPPHLRMASQESRWEGSPLGCGGAAAPLQERLYQDHGLIALNHSDSHAPCVLESLLVVLRSALPRHFVQQCKSFQYVYAFAGHDDKNLIASYHRQMQAISVGGASTYRLPLSPVARIKLLVALSHEIGHAFLFCAYRPSELVDLAAHYGGWPEAAVTDPIATFYDPALFREHPWQEGLRRQAAQGAGLQDEAEALRARSLVSSYALTNLHEWFAEAFAAYILRILGEKGELGGGWPRLVEAANRETSDLWTNYFNLSDEFTEALARKLGDASPL